MQPEINLTEIKKSKDFIVACVIYFCILIAVAVMRILITVGVFNSLNDGALEALFSIVVQVIAMSGFCFVGWFIYLKRKNRAKNAASLDFAPPKDGEIFRETTRAFGFRKIDSKTVAFAFLLGFLMFLFNILFANFFRNILDAFGYRFPSGDDVFVGWSGFLITMILTAILPALGEETAHRGMLLNSFAGRLGVRRAVVLVALLFGLMHMNIVQFFYATMLGYIMGLTVAATKSIWTGIILHFMNNGLSTYFAFAEDLGLPFENLVGNLFGTLFTNYIGILIGIALLVWGMFAIIRKFARASFEKEKDYKLAKLIAYDPVGIEILNRQAGRVLTIEELKRVALAIPEKAGLFGAIRFYLDDFERPKKLLATEKALVWAIISFSALITIFTFVWGAIL
ncbi:MAG: CPBP family intramembrane metalloprotease [Christensenellaceae bacterium]|jgi:membrane protease YdiL (CAAX protease family)|nr:CPBP family intramembrane metalloprotease [Christensenellaceae bacterium]